jgi:DNA polymerase I-like protein with 3'-5' exonuclease and polymerase domains
VFFNAKFDLHWYRRVGFKLYQNIWCCQLAEFLLSGQKIRYPSLEETAVKYGLGHKIDVIKLEYWDKGINTDEIPQGILAEYCIKDVDLTYQIYLKQLAQFKQNPALFKLFKLQCQDLLVLEEMEWNGQLYDEALCLQKAEVIQKEIDEISAKLKAIYPDIPINFNSPEQISAFLYGGKVYQETKEHVGYFKSGKQKDQPKYKNVTIEHVLPRLVEPLPNSGLAKDGVFKTDEGTLRKLKGPAAKKYVGLLLRLSELDKLNSTYYRGLPKKNQKHNWPQGMIHGQFNQVVVQTGRLSSSNPNLQNFAGDCLDVFVTRYH